MSAAHDRPHDVPHDVPGTKETVLQPVCGKAKYEHLRIATEPHRNSLCMSGGLSCKFLRDLAYSL